MKKFLIASGVAVLAFASVAAAQTFTANLTVGSTGPQVVALQSALMGAGFNIPAIASGVAQPGYFGSQTLTAVKLYQASKGIPNTGFVGPLTRGALNMGGTAGASCPAGQVCTPINPVVTTCPTGFICTPIGGGTSTTGTTGLAGTDGNISDVQELSQYNNEEVGDGQNDIKVLGFEVEASNDGDILLKNIKLTFNGTSNSGSDNLDDYIDGVTVWLGSTEIGSADVSAFNEDSNGIYSKTITLKSGTVIKADDTAKLYVSVDAAGNLDSGDLTGDAWTIALNSIRFEDGSGVVTTESDAGDLSSGVSTSINFSSFSSAADTELKISDNDSPEEGIVVVDDSNDTDDVVMLIGKMKLEGTSDAVIDAIPVTLTTVLGGGVQSVVNSLTLKIGSEEYTETVSTSTAGLTGAGLTGVITFDDLNYTLKAGETVTFTVLADVNDIETPNFNEGDDLVISLTSANRDAMDVENEEGDQLSDSSEKSGTVTGSAQEFRTEGIGLTLVSVIPNSSTPTSGSFPDSPNNDTGLFVIKYKVTAVGDTMYLSSLPTTAGLTYAVDKNGTATTSNAIAATLVNNTDTNMTAVGNYAIEEGKPETFTLSISVPISAAAGSGQYRAALTGVKWDTSDDTSMAYTYSSSLDDFKTAYQILD